MEEYKFNNAIVRIRGRIDKKKLQEAVNEFMVKVEKQRREKEKEKEEPLS